MFELPGVSVGGSMKEKRCDNCGHKNNPCTSCVSTEYNGERVSAPSNWTPEKPEKKKQNTEAIETIIRALGWLEGISYAAEGNLATGIIDAVQAIEASLKELI